MYDDYKIPRWPDVDALCSLCEGELGCVCVSNYGETLCESCADAVLLVPPTCPITGDMET